MTTFRFTDKSDVPRVAVQCVGSPEHKACPICGELCDLYREEEMEPCHDVSNISHTFYAETGNINWWIWCKKHGTQKLKRRNNE